MPKKQNTEMPNGLVSTTRILKKAKNIQVL